ncbi:MAG: alpha/beta hydrolase [Phycisphaerales bacterium]
MLVLMAAGLAWVWLAAIVSVGWMLTHPPRRTYAWAVSRSVAGDPGELVPARTFESWTLAFEGMELPVWDVAGEVPNGPVVIVTPGWGDSRVGALSRLLALAAWASRVVLWDSPGLGEAPGTCRLGLSESRALARLVDEVADHEAERLVLYGWSMGAGASIVVAASDSRIAGVIAESPYREAKTPARNVLAARGLPWRLTLMPALWVLWLAWTGRPPDRGFDRALHAKRVRCPLLVLHGERDVVAPLEDGHVIAEAAPNGRIVVVPGAGHNNLWTEHREASAAAVGEFMSAVATRAGAARPASDRAGHTLPS